jgi:hypothetical protein
MIDNESFANHKNIMSKENKEVAVEVEVPVVAVKKQYAVTCSQATKEILDTIKKDHDLRGSGEVLENLIALAEKHPVDFKALTEAMNSNRVKAVKEAKDDKTLIAAAALMGMTVEALKELRAANTQKAKENPPVASK